jgi:hypothetical protein
MVLMTKRLIRGAIKTVAGLAALVFFLARLTTNTGLLLFVGSIVVLLVCFGLLRFLEDDDDNTGYWPTNPKDVKASMRSRSKSLPSS